jgi:hypothetical protein
MTLLNWFGSWSAKSSVHPKGTRYGASASKRVACRPPVIVYTLMIISIADVDADADEDTDTIAPTPGADLKRVRPSTERYILGSTCGTIIQSVSHVTVTQCQVCLKP